METLDEGPSKAAWRELESQVLELCAYYDPRAPQQWLSTQMGPGGNRMRELSRCTDYTPARRLTVAGPPARLGLPHNLDPEGGPDG